MCTGTKEPSVDSDDMVGILQDFGLQAVNTFDKLGSYTHIHEQHAQKHRSFLDYVTMSWSDAEAPPSEQLSAS